MRSAEKDTKSNSFLKLLELTYQNCKKRFQEKQELFDHVTSINKYRERKQERTRSKSRGKSSKIQSTAKAVRSLRNNKIQSEVEYGEIDKQPLWHHNKRNQKSRQRKQKTPKIVSQQKRQLKIKPSNPLYQFYSQQQIQQQIQQTAKPDINDEDNVDENIGMEPQAQPLQEELQNWKPTKQQISMLSIQHLIDEYVMFKHNLRNNSLMVKFTDLCRYVREIKGYYFNIEVLQHLIRVNGALYQMHVIDRERFVKCARLTPMLIQQRQLQTKIKMMKME